VTVVMKSSHDENGGLKVEVRSFEQNVLKEPASRLDFLVLGKLIKWLVNDNGNEKDKTRTL
jgi:hypothetical protein